METKQSGISHFATVIGVSNIQDTIKWYKNKLGFEITFSWGEPMDYAVLKRGDNISIHFSRIDEFSKAKVPENTLIYFFVYDVDAIHAEFVENGVEDIRSPEDREYGMRDFDLIDPNGYRLSFGRGG